MPKPKKKQAHQSDFDFAVEPGAKQPIARAVVKRPKPRQEQPLSARVEAPTTRAAPTGLAVLHRNAKSVLRDLKDRMEAPGAAGRSGDASRLLGELEVAVDELAAAHSRLLRHASDLERRVNQKGQVFDAF